MEGLNQDPDKGSPDANKVPDVYDKLEILIRSQSTDEKSVQDVLIDLGTPIISIGILDKGAIMAKAIGSSRSPGAASMPESSRLFDNNTLFQAASISKPITALAVIKLCQEGRLNLDTPISKYLSPEQLSWISTPQTRALVSQITLRHLLSHTSGLSVHGFAGYSTNCIPTIPQVLRGDTPANNEPVTLFTFPGQRFSYSGGGFTVIQLILETELQTPFHQIMDEVVLQPLKMARSTFKSSLTDGENYAPSYLTGKNKSDPDHYVFPELPAAGLWTTPSELLRAVHAVQKSLQLDDFLARTWAEVMLTEVEDNWMALGWMAKKGTIHFEHRGGNDPGYMCFVSGYADLPRPKGEEDKEDRNKAENRDSIPKECGISIMTSSALGNIALDKCMTAILYLKGWPSISETPEIPFMDRASTIDAHAKDWCGDWGPGDWSLVNEEEIFVRYGSLPSVPLVPAALPPHKYDEGNSIDLVADGLELMLRLAWKEGARIIEIWQDGDATILERKA